MHEITPNAWLGTLPSQNVTRDRSFSAEPPEKSDTLFYFANLATSARKNFKISAPLTPTLPAPAT